MTEYIVYCAAVYNLTYKITAGDASCAINFLRTGSKFKVSNTELLEQDFVRVIPRTIVAEVPTLKPGHYWAKNVDTGTWHMVYADFENTESVMRLYTDFRPIEPPE